MPLLDGDLGALGLRDDDVLVFSVFPGIPPYKADTSTCDSNGRLLAAIEPASVDNHNALDWMQDRVSSSKNVSKKLTSVLDQETGSRSLAHGLMVIER